MLLVWLVMSGMDQIRHSRIKKPENEPQLKYAGQDMTHGALCCQMLVQLIKGCFLISAICTKGFKIKIFLNDEFLNDHLYRVTAVKSGNCGIWQLCRSNPDSWFISAASVLIFGAVCLSLFTWRVFYYFKMRKGKNYMGGRGVKTKETIEETGDISEKEPFIQHCFYSNVFKEESEDKLDWESAEGDRVSNEDNMYKRDFFFFCRFVFIFTLFSSNKRSEWESTFSKSMFALPAGEHSLLRYYWSALTIFLVAV